MKVDLQSPVDLVVGTPGTLLQFCEKGMEHFEVLTKFICRGFFSTPSLRNWKHLKLT